MEKEAKEDLMGQKGVVPMAEAEIALTFLRFPTWSILS